MYVIRLSSTAGMLAAVRAARSITVSSYVLRPGPVERALEAAARRGARVRVRLDGYLWGGTPAMSQANRQTIRSLRNAGADARIVHSADSDGPALHMKAVVCDGVAYLDDCNWNPSGDTIVRDDAPRHVRAVVHAALQCDVAPVGRLSLTKADALAAEAHVLNFARHSREADVETEELHGAGISAALRKLASAGVKCRLLVSKRALRKDSATRAIVISLEKAGVDVRSVDSSEKMAIAGKHRAWVGSADATKTYYDGDRIEWSLTARDEKLVRGLKSRFTAHWRDATPV